MIIIYQMKEHIFIINLKILDLYIFSSMSCETEIVTIRYYSIRTILYGIFGQVKC